MSKTNFEVLKDDNSKKRKTFHSGDTVIVKNPLSNFDLNEVNDLPKELESASCHVDYVINSHKKRTFNSMKNENKIFVSHIPKPMRNINIYYSKYSDYPSKIPKNF